LALKVQSPNKEELDWWSRDRWGRCCRSFDG